MVPVSLGYLCGSTGRRSRSGWRVPLAIMGLGMWLMSSRLERHSLAVQETLAEIGQPRAGELRRHPRRQGLRPRTSRSRASRLRGEEPSTTRSSSAGRAASRTRSLGRQGPHLLPILLVGGWAMIDRTLAAGDLFKFIDLTLQGLLADHRRGLDGRHVPARGVSARASRAARHRARDRTSRRSRGTPEVRGELELSRRVVHLSGRDKPASPGSPRRPAGQVLGVVGPTGFGQEHAAQPARAPVRRAGRDRARRRADA
jgi:hypothetical protein